MYSLTFNSYHMDILASVPTSSHPYSKLIFLSEIIVVTADHGFSTSHTTISIYSSHHPAHSLYRTRRGTLHYTRNPKSESWMGRLAGLAGLGKGEFLDILITALIPTTFEGPHFRNGNRHYCGDRPRGPGASDAPHRSIAGISSNEL